MPRTKTASKHTPGPWEVRVADPALDEVEDTNLYVLDTPLVGKTIGEIIDQQEATARLIVQAPEMYELLEKVTDIQKNVRVSLRGNVCITNDVWLEVANEARRIKAEIDGIE